MSFWPFGQSLNNSNINKILDEYFNVLHTLEKTNPAVAKCVHENISSNSNSAIGPINVSGDDISSADMNQDVGGNDGGARKTRIEGFDSSLTPMPQRFNSGRGSSSSSSGSSSNSSASSLSTDSGTSSKTDMDEDDIASATAPIAITIQSLNSSFIERLLEESELLNELTRQNSTLLDFICFGFFYDSKSHAKIQNLEYLIDQMMDCIDKIVTSTTMTDSSISQDDFKISKEDDDHQFLEDTATGENENKESKFLSRATIISEIFSLDIWLISESLVKNQSYLAKIWSIINHPNLQSEKSPLVPIFLKINQNLLLTRQDQYLNFIRSRSDLVDDMLSHVEISMLMDFFLKCIATDKVEAPTGIVEIVDDQQLISKCLKFLNNEKYTPDIQACAGDFLKALIAISANAPLDDMSIGPNNLTRELASTEKIDQLVDIIVRKRGSALNITVSIVIELIRKNNSDYDQVNLLTTTTQTHPPSHRDPIYLGYMLRKFAMELPGLFQIILDAEAGTSKPMLENQLHEMFRPLGFERFKVVELIAELLHCSNMGLMNSKKAEKIARERDRVRKQLALQLQDALEDLTITEKSHDKKENHGSVNNGDCSTNENIHKTKDVNELNHSIDKTHVNDDDEDDDDDDDESNDYDNDSNDDKAKNIASGDGENVGTNEPISSYGSKDDKDCGDDNSDDENDEDVDESFEIPYVNENQSEKLRKNPTIGDLFKIKLYDTQVLPKITELFLSHPWNNFWHNVIFDIIQQIFNGRMDFSYNSFLVYSLFNLRGSFLYIPDTVAKHLVIKDFELTKDFILQGYKNSYDFYEKKHMNLGYMGHLVLIAEEVVKFSKLYKVELISPDIHNTLKDEEWRFYAEDVLNDTRLMYSKILGGGNYIDDGNGNIIPQLPDISPQNTNEQKSLTDEVTGGGLINVESLEEQLGLSTESDLHEKLRELLIANAQQEVETKNKQNGVIILGPPEDDIEKDVEATRS